MLDPGGAPSGPQSGLGPTLGSGDLATPAASIGAEEPCRFPKLEECAHFHYERVQLPKIELGLKGDLEISVHSHSGNAGTHYYTIQVTCRDECWLIQRTFENFIMLDAQLHQCIYDRKVSRLPDLQEIKERKERHRRRRCKSEGHDVTQDDDFRDENDSLEPTISHYLSLLSSLIDNSLNCGPILNWFQLDNRGHRLLVPHEDLRSINTPAVAAAYSVRRYVSQARDELNLEVGDMISVIDMASPGESVWWRGKRGFQVGFFPQYCVHIIGDKVPRNVILPAPVVGSLAISPIKPVLRKHGKLITFFRSFILNRPSRRRLKQSGILKERVFGCDLGEHLLNSGHDIPMVLKCCAEFIESHGIVDGIYRLSGVTSNIQKLRNAFDEDRIPNLYTDDILQDIHSVASLLKMYFRELPNPLCTYQLYQSFVQAVQGCSAARNKQNDNERLLKMREAVQKLPPPHYRTLEYLMRHLQLISTHGHNTGMTTRNLAIVWAPNLLRCEELEIGGVAALQGVGVQAVVTEFLVCYADLIFSEKVPIESSLAPPSTEIDPHESKDEKRLRPKSLAISTPTKLITLEEARNKQLLNKDDGNYIDVGGGPNSLPKKYHTVIELPPGSRKRGLSKRSPSGWRSFFSKSRNSSHGNLSKNRDISSPGIIPMDKSVTESDLNDIKRKLRPVKSAESLTSGQSEPANCETDVLGPLHCLSKASGHNRSVSHDSYFDNLQSSQNNSVGSLLDLSEIQLNFELEESEMRIFSEDESLVSSPKVCKESGRKLNRSRLDDFSSVANSANPSPKKQPRVVISPESLSRKRSRLEDQLSDIQYIDCTTPESNICLISTTALVHNETKDSLPNLHSVVFEGYQPKNKSPRNENRHSLNFEKIDKITIPKSFTDIDFKNMNLSPSPGSPIYKPLHTSSTNSPNLSLDLDSPKNLTTISITYKSPKKNESIYETIELNPEKAVVPTTESSLPIQEASMPKFPMETKLLETSFDNSFSTSITSSSTTLKDENSLDSEKNIPKRPTNLNFSENIATDLSLDSNFDSENSKKSLITETENVPNSSNNSSGSSSEITPTQNQTNSLDFDEVSESKTMESILSDISSKKDKRKSCDAEFLDENSIYQQVKYFRRSIHEINSLLDLEKLPKSKSTDNITDLHPNLGKTDFNSLKIDFEGLSHPTLGVGTYQTLEEHPKMGNSTENINLEPNTHPKMGATHYENINPDLEHNLEQNSNPKMGVNSPENVYLDYENVSDPNLDLKIGVAHYEDLAQSLEHNLEQIPDPNMGVENKSSVLCDYENISNEIFDSLESDNVNIYENIETNKSLEDSRTNLEHSKTKFQEINPKIVKISNEEILDLPVCQKCTSDDKISVKNLTSRFETKKIYDKDSLPPCLRAKNNKNNIKTRSLDENAFSVEFGHIQRRKSLDDRVSSYINSKILSDNKNSSTSDISVDIKKDLNLGDQKLNRERIEKYKEERRIFLREKYRSESFKEDKDLLLQRFKHKNIKKDENVDSSRDITVLNTEKDIFQPKKLLEDHDFTKKRLETNKNDPMNTKKHAIPNFDTKKPVLDQKFGLKPDKKPLLDQDSPLLDRLLDEKFCKLEQFEKRPILDSKKQVLDPKKSVLHNDSPVLDRLLDEKTCKSSFLDQKFGKNLDQKLPDRKNTKASHLEHKSGHQTVLEPKESVLQTKKAIFEQKSPVFERKTRLKELSEILDESVEDSSILLRCSREDLRHRRSDEDKIERRRHTYDLLRERETDIDRRQSLESRPRDKKCSPAYTIRDMKAIFESKSQQ